MNSPNPAVQVPREKFERLAGKNAGKADYWERTAKAIREGQAAPAPSPEPEPEADPDTWDAPVDELSEYDQAAAADPVAALDYLLADRRRRPLRPVGPGQAGQADPGRRTPRRQDPSGAGRPAVETAAAAAAAGCRPL